MAPVLLSQLSDGTLIDRLTTTREAPVIAEAVRRYAGEVYGAALPAGETTAASVTLAVFGILVAEPRRFAKDPLTDLRRLAATQAKVAAPGSAAAVPADLGARLGRLALAALPQGPSPGDALPGARGPLVLMAGLLALALIVALAVWLLGGWAAEHRRAAGSTVEAAP